jgi:hypothetical protein
MAWYCKAHNMSLTKTRGSVYYNDAVLAATNCSSSNIKESRQEPVLMGIHRNISLIEMKLQVQQQSPILQ